MSTSVEILKNLDRRVDALETERFDDYSEFTMILKHYADVEIEIKLTAWLHTYRKAGDSQPLYGAVCGIDTFL